MTYLRGTTYSEQSSTRDLNGWVARAGTPSLSFPTDVLRSFVAAARETISPAAAREFFRTLDANDPLVSRLGWALMLMVPLFAAFGLLLPSHGPSPWTKPIKFSLSFSTFASTMSMFLLALRVSAWQLKLARRLVAGSIALEIFSLAAQASRSSFPHVHGLIDLFLGQLTNSMVMVNTAVVTWVLLLLFANRVQQEKVSLPMLVALRQSTVIFLLGNAIGGYMLALGSHTVGAPDGGPGLPFLNWSTIAGDLRAAHFIALHAIQVLPLFALVLERMSPALSTRRQRTAVTVASCLLTVLVGATFVQAALGHPLLALR